MTEWSPFNPSSPTSFSEIGHLSSFGTGTGQLESPWGVDVVNGDVYVADTKLDEVQVFQTNGTYLGHFGSKGNAAGQFNQPSEIANDASGNIYVADANVGRVQEFSYSVIPPASGQRHHPAHGDAHLTDRPGGLAGVRGDHHREPPPTTWGWVTWRSPSTTPPPTSGGTAASPTGRRPRSGTSRPRSAPR